MVDQTEDSPQEHHFRYTQNGERAGLAPCRFLLVCLSSLVSS